ncbi:MAG TPA: SDR family oxidoreductase, partial [Baekduia sp.]
MRGRTVLVTGGSRGLGRMMARGLAEHGATVLATSRADAGPVDLAAEAADLPGAIVALHADLATEDGCAALAAAVAEHAGALDVVVHNAGMTVAAPIEDHDDAVWDEVVDVNLKAVFHLTRFLLPSLRAAAALRPPARVITIGSASGIGVSRRENWSYGATKAGVHHLTRHLALKLGPDIVCNTVAPGAFATDMTDRMPPEWKDALIAGTPAGRMGTAADLVGAVVFLASPAGSFLTGTVLPLDGGLSLTT